MSNTLTAIITVWKRNNLKRQIDAILDSTERPSRIIVFQNESNIDITSVIKEYKIEHVHAAQTNFKYHARFALCLGIDSDYFAVYDDDTIPGKKWHSTAIETSTALDAIVGSNGRSYLREISQQFASGGVSNGQFSEKPIPSDIVGHAWVLKKQHICNMFSVPVSDYSTGEDIHLSLVNKTFFQVNTVVPPQPQKQPDTWGDCEPALGLDEHASYLRFADHNTNRNNLFEFWLAKGWRPYYSSRQKGSSITAEFQGWTS